MMNYDISLQQNGEKYIYVECKWWWTPHTSHLLTYNFSKETSKHEIPLGGISKIEKMNRAQVYTLDTHRHWKYDSPVPGNQPPYLCNRVAQSHTHTIHPTSQPTVDGTIKNLYLYAELLAACLLRYPRSGNGGRVWVRFLVASVVVKRCGSLVKRIRLIRTYLNRQFYVLN